MAETLHTCSIFLKAFQATPATALLSCETIVAAAFEQFEELSFDDILSAFLRAEKAVRRFMRRSATPSLCEADVRRLFRWNLMRRLWTLRQSRQQQRNRVKLVPDLTVLQPLKVC